MIELLRLKSFYIIFYIFIIILAASINKIKADQDIVITADEILVRENGKIIEANGNVFVEDEKNQSLQSEFIHYNKTEKKLTASNDVVFTDQEENIYHLDNFNSENNIENIKGNNVKIRLNDQSRVVGSSIIKENNLSVLNDAEYTPCIEDNYLIENCPGWKLKADKIYHDQETKTMHYDNARIHLMNIPVMYLPYFSHPDPSVKKRSGLLMPTIETDNNLGDTFSIPIFYNIADNQDFTITPTLQSKSNNFYSLNYRYLDKRLRLNIDASMDDNNDNGGTSNHLFFDADIFNPYGDLETFLKTSNNDTYMRKNKINKLTVLNSGISFQKQITDRYFSIETNSYKHLTVQGSEQMEYVYPQINYNIYNIQNSLFGGTLSLLNNGLIKRDLNENYTSLFSSQVDWKNSHIDSKNGIVLNNETNLRIVSISADNKNTKDTENIRFFPQISSKISYPLMLETEGTMQSLSPSITPILAPYNNYTENIIITNSNISSLNRASSITEWESGPRINYGLEWFNEIDNGTSMSISLGQSYRFNKNNSDTIDELSDYFLSSNVSISKNNYLNNSFIIDRNDKDIKSINMNTFNEYNKLKIAIDYDYTSGKYSSAREQIGIGGELNIAENLFLKFTGSKNIDTNKNIGYQYGILYENDCLGIDLNYFRDLTVDRDISESDGFSFTIVLKPFGSTKNYGNSRVFGPSID